MDVPHIWGHNSETKAQIKKLKTCGPPPLVIVSGETNIASIWGAASFALNQLPKYNIRDNTESLQVGLKYVWHLAGCRRVWMRLNVQWTLPRRGSGRGSTSWPGPRPSPRTTSAQTSANSTPSMDAFLTLTPWKSHLGNNNLTRSSTRLWTVYWRVSLRKKLCQVLTAEIIQVEIGNFHWMNGRSSPFAKNNHFPHSFCKKKGPPDSWPHKSRAWRVKTEREIH